MTKRYLGYVIKSCFHIKGITDKFFKKKYFISSICRNLTIFAQLKKEKMKKIIPFFAIYILISFLTSTIPAQIAKPVNNADDKVTCKDTGLASYSKFDFIPGENIIFYDDFSSENVGDFPLLWNTNGSGEIVTTNLFPGKWFKITNSIGATCLSDSLSLPENYTIEFDVIPQKDPSNAQNSKFCFLLISTKKPKDLKYGLARPGGTGIKFEFAFKNSYFAYYYDGSPGLTGFDTENKQLADNKYRISIWVQKERIRVYQNDVKLFDLAKAMSKNFKYNMIRFDGGVPMISNVRIATGQADMRNKLLTEGKLISYGIYFDSGKDIVKAESYGTLKEIATVLTENPTVNIKIVGYTDSDGEDAMNLELSKKRAIAVKAALNKEFAIDNSRMETDGKGETEPVSPNTTTEGKAKNRRVEFIKL